MPLFSSLFKASILSTALLIPGLIQADDHAAKNADEKPAVDASQAEQAISLDITANVNQPMQASHALAIHGEPKYPGEFYHFDYAAPSAPQGGKVVIGVLGSFDSLNPFILKGVPTEAMTPYVFESLTIPSYDEPGVVYGLLAKKIVVPEDRSFVEFYLHETATFSDGTPVTADDVLFSFKTLREQGHPHYRAYYKTVAKTEKLSDTAVRFLFDADSISRELPVILGELPVMSEAYYTANEFNSTSLDAPLGSGPYNVTEVKGGHRVVLEKRDDYWGKDLGVNNGRFNIDTLVFDYYRDATVALEAFKAGQFDFRLENVARQWATAYDFPAVKNGEVTKESIRHQNSSGMQGFIFNLRRDKFKDARVREALSYAFDFEHANKTLFYSMYTRTNSYFDNSELASSGVPEGDELALLEPYREQLPASVFTAEFQPPRNTNRRDFRQNLRKAKQLLTEAGYTVNDKGILTGPNGEAFTFEILLVMPTFERVVSPYLQNLEKLGIKATMRTVDVPQYKRRVDHFEFDITTTVIPQSQSPGNEQRAYWHSSVADLPGTRNLMGANNPVVDALVEKVIAAPDRDSLVTATRALDRVLLSQHYVIPHWHTNDFRVAYWNKLQRPETNPPFGLTFPDFWWVTEEKTQ